MLLSKGSFHFVFSSDSIADILNEISRCGNFFIDGDTEIMSGIDVLQDFVSKDSAKKLNEKFKVGDGVFVLNKGEISKMKLSEKEYGLLKPYYTTENLGRYYGSEQNEYWIIYTDSSFKDESKIKMYPQVKKHLDNFLNIFTSDNKPYGLHRSRDENFFKGEKIFSLRKCAIPTFTYTDFDCYVSRAFIVVKTNRINQKYLTALLNSKLVAFWLRHKGKMQGLQYQIDKGPLIEIPLIKTINTGVFEDIVDYIFFINQNIDKPISDFVTNEHLLKTFEDLLNVCVFELYFAEHMKEKGLDILNLTRGVIKSINHSKIKDEEKRKIINDVYNTVNDSKSEIRNRMLLIPIESKEVLLPIQKIY